MLVSFQVDLSLHFVKIRLPHYSFGVYVWKRGLTLVGYVCGDCWVVQVVCLVQGKILAFCLGLDLLFWLVWCHGEDSLWCLWFYFRLYSISLLCSFCSVSSDVVETQGCCLDSRLIQRVSFLGTFFLLFLSICVPICIWSMASICMSLILCWLLPKWYVGSCGALRFTSAFIFVAVCVCTDPLYIKTTMLELMMPLYTHRGST